MVWIVPKKRASKTQSRLFSKYKNIIVDEHFILQKRKNSAPPSSRPPYRIITRGEYPYYEIAWGENLKDLKAHEWAYIADAKFEKLIPVGVDSKFVKRWFVAHFTQLALEMDTTIHKDSDSDSAIDQQRSIKATLAPSSIKVGRSFRPRSPTSSTRSRSPSAPSPSLRVDPVVPKLSAISGKNAYVQICLLVNVILILLRDASGVGFTAAMFTINVFLLLIVLRETGPFVLFWGTQKSKHELAALVASVSTTGSLSPRPPARVASHSSPIEPRKPVVAPAPKRATKVLVPVTKETDSESSSSDDEVPANVEVKAPEPEKLLPKPLEERQAGQSTCYDYEESLHAVNSWCTTDAANFRVRIPPNYKKNKGKGPSGASLFHCAGIDIFYSGGKHDDIGSKISLPPFNYEDDKEVPRLSKEQTKEMATCNGVPAVFIVNFQIPGYSPNLFAPAGNGLGYSVVMYFVLKKQTREHLLNLETAPNSIRLLKRFCEGYQTEGLHSRLKCIPQVVNIDELDLGMTVNAALSKYNAKPFLTGPKFHTFHRGEGYLEVDVDIHRFCFMARQFVDKFLPYLPRMVIDVGLVIEGVGDEEQPEAILGCCRLFKIDHKAAHLTENVEPPS